MGADTVLVDTALVDTVLVDTVLVDTNVLLTATVPGRPLHDKALTVLNDWPEKGVTLSTSPQVLREYLVVATRPVEVNGLGLEVEEALDNVTQLRTRLRLLDERIAGFERLFRLVREVGCRGKQVHDANVVATALAHDVGHVLTANVQDFRRFSVYVGILDLANVEITGKCGV